MSAAAPAWPADLFAGRRFAVLGLGRNGAPVARALLAMGAEVSAWDDQAAAREAAADLPLREPDLARVEALVLSPGIPHLLPRPHPAAAAAMAAGVPILSDAELLFQAARRALLGAQFAGITGTNGKSTTTALLAHILLTAGRQAVAGGNLGTAALALPPLPGGAYVLEMSSYMLERLHTLRFDTAAMLNLSADHLERHGSMASYAAAKRAIFDRQGDGDTAVLGIDDADSGAMADGLRGPRIVRVSGERPADIWCDGTLLRDAQGVILDMRDAPALPGTHNAQNMAAAAATAFSLGVSRDDLARGAASFSGLPHRQQRAGQVDGVQFINDSKATNADAAARALSCYDRLVWIAGGQAKTGGIESLAPFFPRIAHALLIGRDAPDLARTLAAAGVPHTECGTLDTATPEALAAAKRLDAPVVLLSPACASWDQFTGFDARGDRFVALVGTLASRRAA